MTFSSASTFFFHSDRQQGGNYLKGICMCLIELFLVFVQSEVIIQVVKILF